MELLTKPTWYDFYKARMNDQYREHVASRYEPFIERVAHQAMRGRFVMEAGCGAANVSRVVQNRIARSRFQVLVDNDPDVLSLAHQNMVTTGAENFVLVRHDILQPSSPSCQEFADWFQPGMYGLVYSHGVLEHFGDHEIRLAIQRQMELLEPGGKLLHYVPSAKYEKPSFGDERLMTPDQWDDICNPDCISFFNHGRDLVLEWRKP
jgi:trans-aconitate methyltransferase